jgi:CubicO group peptidase (beta-lactamase class C family)
MKNKYLNFAVLAMSCCVALGVSGCASVGEANPKEMKPRYAKFTQQLDAMVEAGSIPGSITYVVENGQVAFTYKNGWQDIASKTPLKDDSIFRLYSMTKPITSVAIMMLQERGQLSVNDPVSKYLPDFANTEVYQSGGLEDMVTAPPARPMTIDDLLAHKSGLTYHFTGKTPVHQYYRKYGVKRNTPVGALPTDGEPAKDLAQLTERLAKAPLLSEPGERFTYSYSTTVLGRIVEVVSGQPLDVFLKSQLFQPLGMKDTSFHVLGADLERFVTNYLATPNGAVMIENSDNTDYKDLTRLLDGGGALAATAEDYLAFATMLANKGVYKGKRILSESSINAMFVPRIKIEGLGPQQTTDFGYGFAIGSTDSEAKEYMPDGTYGWAGSGNTIFWVNPETHSLVLFMTQVIVPPNLAEQMPLRRYLINVTASDGQ